MTTKIHPMHDPTYELRTALEAARNTLIYLLDHHHLSVEVTEWIAEQVYTYNKALAPFQRSLGVSQNA